MAYKLSAIFNLEGNYIRQMQQAQQATGGMNNTLATVSGGFSKLRGTILKVGAAIGLGLGLKDMIAKASAGELKIAQLDAVLKSTGGAAGVTKDQVLALATAQSQLTTYSKGANIETENLLLTFTSIGKDVFPDALKTVNDMSTALGQDTKSSAVQLGKALQDPIKGITALSRVGVNFTSAQKEQIKTLVESGQTMKAQQIILKELGTEFGGSAEAAGKTFSGQMTILKNNMAGVSSQIGATLLPYLEKFTTLINSSMPKIKQAITDVINTIVPKFQEWVTIIGQIATELFPSLGGSVDGVKGKVSGFSGVLDGVTDVLKFVRDNIELVKGSVITLGTAYVTFKTVKGVIDGVRSAQELWTNATKAWTRASEIAAGVQKALSAAWAANPIGIAIALVAALVVGLVYLFNHNKAFHDFVVNSWAVIKRVVSDSINAVIGFFKHLGTSISGTWEGIKAGVSNFLGSIKNFFVNGWNSVKASTENAWNGIKQFFVSIVTAIVSFVTTTFSKQIGDIKVIFLSVAMIFRNAWDAIKNIFLGSILLILDLVTGNFTKLKEDAKHIFANLVEDFSNIWANIKNIFTHYLDLIGTTFSQAWNVIKSTAMNVWNSIMATSENIWNGLGRFLASLWEGIISTLSSAWESLKSFVINLCSSIVSGAIATWNGLMAFFEGLPSTMQSAGANMFTSLKNGISSILNGLGTFITNGFNSAITFITSLPGKALQWGKDFIQGLIDGITGAIGGIGKAVSGVADTIRSYLHFSVPDVGPLTDYMSWMPDMLKGMSHGIKVNTHLVTDKVKDIAVGIKENVQQGTSGAKETGSTGPRGTSRGDLTLTINMYGNISNESDMDRFVNALVQKLDAAAANMA